jgi:hypothetical protein
MKVNLEYSTEYNNLLKHEQRVDNFLKTKRIPKDYLKYDNLMIYTKAKQTLGLSIVSNKDSKTINKFIKNWIIHKGNINSKYIKQMVNITNHYAKKTKDLALRNARLQRKKNLKLTMA